jgi:hypothetical protein
MSLEEEVLETLAGVDVVELVNEILADGKVHPDIFSFCVGLKDLNRQILEYECGVFSEGSGLGVPTTFLEEDYDKEEREYYRLQWLDKKYRVKIKVLLKGYKRRVEDVVNDRRRRRSP